MATGYTCDIEKGQSFKDFAIGCAKAFGANIMLRDELVSAPIPKYEPSDYHMKEAKKAKKDLAKLLATKDSALEVEFQKEQLRALESRTNRSNANNELKLKYETMLEKVKAFNPPTQDHVGYKDFMIEQLETSILFDCGHSHLDDAEEITFDKWKIEQIENLSDNVEYHEREYEEEVKRTNERNEWNQKLFDALKDA